MRYKDLMEADRAEDLRQRLLHDPLTALGMGAKKEAKPLSELKAMAFRRGFKSGMAGSGGGDTGVSDAAMDAFHLGLKKGAEVRNQLGNVPPATIKKNSYGDKKPNQAFERLYKPAVEQAIQSPEVQAVINAVQEGVVAEAPAKKGLNPEWFNGDRHPKKVAFLKREWVNGSKPLLWRVDGDPSAEDTFLMTAIDPKKLAMYQIILYTTPESDDGWDWEETDNGVKAMIHNLERAGAYQFVGHLNQIGIGQVDETAIEEEQVDEAFRGWAILPATMALYNKRVVDIKTAASTWDDTPTTILVCSKEEMDGRKRFCFVSSANDDFDYYTPKIGQGFDTYHDQTGAQKGTYVLMNVVVIHNGEIIKKANETGLNAKASLSVFK